MSSDVEAIRPTTKQPKQMTTTTKILDHYLVCALWSSTDDAGAPLDDNYDSSDIAEESRNAAEAEIVDFLALCESEGLRPFMHMGDEQFGHDFWLTRNGHGAGFWDRGLGEVGEKLTELAKTYGSSDAYVGDDGKVYLT